MLKSILKILERQYFRYTVMTGIYMLNSFEAFLLHILLFFILLLLTNYTITSFVFLSEFIKTTSIQSILLK